MDYEIKLNCKFGIAEGIIEATKEMDLVEINYAYNSKEKTGVLTAATNSLNAFLSVTDIITRRMRA